MTSYLAPVGIMLVSLCTARAQADAATSAEAEKPIDPQKATTAEFVVRGSLKPNPAGPGRGGWPTYTLTVAQVFKTPKDVNIAIGQKLTVKTVKEFKGPVTLYLVLDKDQKLYRLQDPLGQRGFSHAETAAPEAKPGSGTKTENQRREVHFSGKVQGVGFRFTTQTLSKKFAVTGFVKNLPDGRVRLIVEGQQREIDKFLSAIRSAREEYIAKIEEEVKPATGEFKAFEIRR